MGGDLVRYAIDGQDGWVEEDPDGDWVNYDDVSLALAAAEVKASTAERERIRRLALAGTEWLEPSDFVPPRASSREGDLWRRAQAVARREFAEEIGDQTASEEGDS